MNETTDLHAFGSGVAKAWAIFSLSIAAASAQSTLTVGAGQAFPTISAAVAVADHGDTVLVVGGVHADAPLIQRGIRLIGQNAAWTSESLPFGSIRIQGVQAPHTFAMSGFELLPVQPGSLSPSVRSITIEDCTAVVSIETLTRAASGPYANWSLTITDSSQVSLRASRLGFCRARDSLVVIENCVLGALITTPLAPLWATGGNTAMVGGELRGGSSVFSTPGLQLDGGSFFATRATIRGGLPTSLSPGAPAIAAAGGEIVLDPSAVLVPSGTFPAVTGGVPVASAEFASSIAMLTPLQLNVASHGPAGEWFALMLSLPGPLAVTPWGLSWVDPSAASVMVLASYGLDREHSFAAPLPPLPAGLAVVMQPIVLAPTGYGLGLPTVVTTR
jgi:hypothetical protein